MKCKFCGTKNEYALSYDDNYWVDCVVCKTSFLFDQNEKEEIVYIDCKNYTVIISHVVQKTLIYYCDDLLITINQELDITPDNIAEFIDNRLKTLMVFS